MHFSCNKYYRRVFLTKKNINKSILYKKVKREITHLTTLKNKETTTRSVVLCMIITFTGELTATIYFSLVFSCNVSPDEKPGSLICWQQQSLSYQRS